MKNYYILNRKPRAFSEMKIAGGLAVFVGDNGRPLDYGVISVDASIYAMLCCDAVRNVTFVVEKEGCQNVVTLLWGAPDSYESGKAELSRLYARATGRRVSRQDKRINRYAEALAEKLSIGVRLKVTDAVDASEMAVCPSCGTLNPAGSSFCMECGEDL